MAYKCRYPEKQEVDAPFVPYCAAGRDGDCYAEDCPQLNVYMAYCPYAAQWEKFWDEGEC